MEFLHAHPWAGNAIPDSVVDCDSYQEVRSDTGERIGAEDGFAAQSFKQGIQTQEVVWGIEPFNDARAPSSVSFR